MTMTTKDRRARRSVEQGPAVPPSLDMVPSYGSVLALWVARSDAADALQELLVVTLHDGSRSVTVEDEVLRHRPRQIDEDHASGRRAQEPIHVGDLPRPLGCYVDLGLASVDLHERGSPYGSGAVSAQERLGND